MENRRKVAADEVVIVWNVKVVDYEVALKLLNLDYLIPEELVLSEEDEISDAPLELLIVEYLPQKL